ncbi:UDPglucose 6-dehydrogenase [Haladaptatus litoreus]|uniref:UDP-glucose 6-dehydrogenase n=1 Tax=Haladaptatus litoreus TaxID=553468 RepID=A0A1N7DC73_9EURY|nr:UDP-glucose 6-dehydrogenase AglM [Haladaptatus litoreus]SIR73374.1 UDPglucose 6-dehydrogenase [Haladaptatus litoreus]
MELSIIGSGYVGTTVAACFAKLGHSVTNIDIDEEVVERINSGDSPIHEPGLGDLVAEYGGNRLRATTDYSAIRDTDATFLALPTPSHEDGSIDTSIIKAGARSLGETLGTKDDYHLVIVKSTVVPGTTEDMLGSIIEETSGQTRGEQFDVAMNPEFLREGSAVEDFLNPDKIVFGTENKRANERLANIFEPLIIKSNPEVVETGIREAEMIKYANNAFLATKVSLVNELGNICKEYEVDAYEVTDAIGLDERIGERFLRSGVGWGGSCFPKDTAALVAAARDRGYEPSIVEAAIEVNNKQPKRLLNLLENHTDLPGKRIAVLGLAFKPGTDDVRNSRSIPIIEELQNIGAEVVAYDPVAVENMREHFPNIEYVDSVSLALKGADGALVVTDWDEFSVLNDEFEQMKNPIVVDGRRIVNNQDNITYEGLTW